MELFCISLYIQTILEIFDLTTNNKRLIRFTHKLLHVVAYVNMLNIESTGNVQTVGYFAPILDSVTEQTYPRGVFRHIMFDVPEIKPPFQHRASERASERAFTCNDFRLARRRFVYFAVTYLVASDCCMPRITK